MSLAEGFREYNLLHLCHQHLQNLDLYLNCWHPVLLQTADIRKSGLKDLADVPYYELEEIKHFFEVYKTLEPGKEVHGGEWVNHDAAQVEIVNSYNRFKQH